MSFIEIQAFIFGATHLAELASARCDVFSQKLLHVSTKNVLREIRDLLQNLRVRIGDTSVSFFSTAYDALIRTVFEALLAVKEDLDALDESTISIRATHNSGSIARDASRRLEKHKTALVACLEVIDTYHGSPVQSNVLEDAVASLKEFRNFAPVTSAQKFGRAGRLTETKAFHVVHDHEEACVDVVFVHGINGHPRDTWAGSTKFWPQDFLSNDLNAQCRVLTYDHRVAYLSGIQQLRIEELAEKFLQDLYSTRAACCERPLIFISHSLGGILVKLALTLDWGRREDPNRASIFRTAREAGLGFIFLGTPHTFSSKHARASLFETMIAIAAAARANDIQDPAETMLGFNEQYPEMSSSFREMVDDQNVHIYSFFEQSAMVSADGPRVITDRYMALHHVKEHQLSLPGDHYSMCKFDHPAETGYTQIIRAMNHIMSAFQSGQARRTSSEPIFPEQRIQSFQGASFRLPKRSHTVALRYARGLDDAVSVVSTTTKASEQDVEDIEYAKQYSRFRSSLEPALSVWKTRKGQRSNEGDWILESEAFHAWYDEDGKNVLFLRGPPGCGKSTASESLYDQLSRTSERFGAKGRICIHLFFSMEESSHHSTDFVLQGLLAQILDQTPELHQLAIRKIRSRSRDDASEPQLLTLLEVLLHNIVSRPIYAVIDGIDECNPSTVSSILDILARLRRCGTDRLILTYSKAVESLSRLQYLTDESSLIEIIKEEKFQKAFFAHIQQRIDEAQRQRARQISNSLSDIGTSIEALKQYLNENHQHSFQWVDLVLEHFWVAAPNMSIPTVESIYESILHKIRSDSNEAISQLSLVACARRPLHVEDFTMCLIYLNNSIDLDNATKEFESGPDTALQTYCARFIYVDSDGLHFSNSNLREFLLSRMRAPTTRTSGEPHLNRIVARLEDVHLQMARACLNLLIAFQRKQNTNSTAKEDSSGQGTPFQEIRVSGTTGHETEGSSDQVSEAKPSFQSVPFFRYALRYWYEHLQAAGTSATLLDRLIKEYVDAINSSTRLLSVDRRENFVETEHVQPIASPSISNQSNFALLQTLTTKNLAHNIKTLMKPLKPDLEQQRQIVKKALAAGAELTTDTIRALVDLVPPVNGFLRDSVQVLLHIQSGEPSKFKSILENSAKNFDEASKEQLLLAAVVSRNVESVRGLLRYFRPPLLGTSRTKTSALGTAIENRDDEIVKALISEEPTARDQNRRRFDLDSCLHLAIGHSNTQICTHLIACGADVNAKNPKNKDRSPLHLACLDGKLELVQTLVAWRARTSARDNEKKTPLHTAAELGHESVVQFLLTYVTSCEETDVHSRTPLFLACALGKAATVKILLSFGSNIFHQDKSNRTTLHAAAKQGSNDVVLFLISAGCPVADEDQDGNTALHEAASSGWGDTAAKLIQANAPVNALNRRAESPLHFACQSNNAPETTVKVLIDYGADPNCLTTTGESPLHYAVRQGKMKVIPILLKNGADPQRRNRAGKSALDLAPDDACRMVLGDDTLKVSLPAIDPVYTLTQEHSLQFPDQFQDIYGTGDQMELDELDFPEL